jgi:hypothetical protein
MSPVYSRFRYNPESFDDGDTVGTIAGVSFLRRGL